MSHKHDKSGNKKIKKAITIAAKASGITRLEFHNAFVFEHDKYATELFWYFLWENFPETKIFENVSFCHGCNAFYFDDLMYGNDNE